MSNLEAYLLRKFKHYNQKQIIAMDNRDVKLAAQWQLRASTVFDIFNDITSQPLLKPKAKAEVKVVGNKYVN